MTTNKEQVTTLGNVRFKPMQRDMFTGNLVKTKPRAGRGDHIVLKDVPGMPSAIPGMAHFAGTGPAGKRCRHCAHCRDIAVWGRDFMSPSAAAQKDDTAARRIERNACAKAAELYDGHVQKGGIQMNEACKYFEAS